VYIPEIRLSRYDRWVTIHVGKVKVGEFFENEEAHELLDRMYAKLIREFFEAEGVNFEEEEGDDD
jgi:hypothetical protein